MTNCSRLPSFFWVLLCLTPGWLMAAQPEMPPDNLHAWARFGCGSWKLVRVQTETLDGQGRVASVSLAETKTTLERADNKSYTLRIEVTVEVAGKRLKAEPKLVTYGYSGEMEGQQVEVKELGSGEVEINGNLYPTSVRQIMVNGGASKTISTVHYSREVAPHFLKRSTESSDIQTNARSYQSDVEVIAIDMPIKVLTETKTAAYVRTVESFANGESKVTLEVQCDDVPGGVVSHTSKQTNEAGDILQRSTFELVDYAIVSKPTSTRNNTSTTIHPRRRLFSRRR